MKIVVTDHAFPDLAIEEAIASAAGTSLVATQTKDPARLAEAVADADAVITQFAPVNADVVNAMRRARAIVRYGIGVDNVDLAAARARGIPVCNIPDYCIDEVADHTLAFILALTRQVAAQSRMVHAGEWKLAAPPAAFRTLAGMNCGVVGFGRIGRAVVRRLVAFGGRVLVSDPVAAGEAVAAAGAEAVPLQKLFAESDLVTLHCPSLPETKGMLNAATLAEAKPGLLIVNLSRGDLVDSAALVAAIDSGQVAGAALDVFAPEPIPAGHPILGRANVILAPHVASVSAAAVHRLRTTAAALAVTALRGGTLASIVNGVSGPRDVSARA
ncbi:C-terminal binding protein [bacterium]|nr:C-terminal binding protein [bacterium]